MELARGIIVLMCFSYLFIFGITQLILWIKDIVKELKQRMK